MTAGKGAIETGEELRVDVTTEAFLVNSGPHLLQTEVEETLKRIQSHKGVIGTMVVNAEGIPIRTTLDNSTTVQYAGLLHQLTMKAKSTVRDIDPQNDLTFLRIRSKKHEIMVAPDKEYLLIVIQNPCE
ncbi:dynein light chain roadblock-type 2 [Arvicola amphibius]|uniref:dynein light chain roadblock-type 2 n=1 Tax=Arvicola amphibius TaxID=1047088 RepID=UPI001C087D82|nr:dynein light chain roadblock-type 2 [Arvicola amphibius]